MILLHVPRLADRVPRLADHIPRLAVFPYRRVPVSPCSRIAVFPDATIVRTGLGNCVACGRAAAEIPLGGILTGQSTRLPVKRQRIVVNRGCADYTLRSVNDHADGRVFSLLDVHSRVDTVEAREA